MTNHLSLANLALIAVAIFLLFYIILGWRKVLSTATPANKQVFQKPISIFLVIYLIYSTVICVLGSVGFFKVVTVPPRFLLVFAPVFATILLLLAAPKRIVLPFLQGIAPAALILVHCFRIVMEVLLLGLFNEGVVPVELTLHGRNFDLVVGILALPVGFWVLKNYAGAKSIALAFNALGLVALMNILSIAAGSIPSTFRVYQMNYLPTYFPGILVTFIVPVAIYLHILSIRQLYYQKN